MPTQPHRPGWGRTDGRRFGPVAARRRRAERGALRQGNRITTDIGTNVRCVIGQVGREFGYTKADINFA